MCRSDWPEILCGNVSWVEEHFFVIFRDFHARFMRCFRTRGGSWASSACSWDIWRALALLAGTFMGHRVIGSCNFCEILYGGIWG